MQLKLNILKKIHTDTDVEDSKLTMSSELLLLQDHLNQYPLNFHSNGETTILQNLIVKNAMPFYLSVVNASEIYLELKYLF